MSLIVKRAAAALVLSMTAAGAQEAPQPAPCSAPEYRQLDFWVGTWDLTWKGPDGEEGAGRNVVTRALGGCVIEERFAAEGDGRPLRGFSVSAYRPATGTWRQTWVDNAGGYLPFTGGPAEEGFRFRLDPGADKRTMRMIWKNVEADGFDWHWQQSPDGGKTWEDRWVIHYQRAE